MKKLSVAEIFYSIQGEGHTLGVPAYFIRLAGCNLMCGGRGTERDKELHNGATWRCDSIEVWMKGKAMDFPAILEQIDRELLARGAHIVFTGGEPLMQQENLAHFIDYIFQEWSFVPTIEVETNGTIKPNLYLMNCVEYWNVSPKLDNSGMELMERINVVALATISNSGRNNMFKFVVSSHEDWDEIVTYYLSHIHRNQIYLMPAADNREQLEDVSIWLVELCKMEVLNFSTRLHITIWNQKTGV